MKLSKSREVVSLDEDRDDLAAFLQRLKDSPEDAIELGGLYSVNIDLTPDIIAAVEAAAKAKLAKVEAELKALGVELDVKPGWDAGEDDDSSDDESEAA